MGVPVVDDTQLYAEVRRCLDDDPRIDGLAVSSDVAGGSVTLSGEVGSFAERLLVLSEVLSVPGVHRVVNGLTVRPSSIDWRLTDDALARDISAAIAGLVEAPVEEVEVGVRNRTVTLRGRVADARRRAQIRHAVEAMPGVAFIENNLGVADQASANKEVPS